jgi:hypothetical protein
MLGKNCLGKNCLGKNCLGKNCLGKNCLGKNYSRFEYFLFLKPNVFPAMGTLQMTSRVSWTCGLGTACSRAGNRANLWWFLVILAKDSC